MSNPSFQLSDELPTCSRCGGELLVNAHMPHTDAAGQPIRLELCATCDTAKPAAGVLLRWLKSGAGRDAARAAEGAPLFLEWQKEAMAVHGWAFVPNPTAEGLPQHTGPTPQGRG
ncbi:DUF6300 family protein [Streptomyces lunaelactis]|uniref:DUF6300 family protein n=1 Tax=Streptomyces lunaelactis TaxID=1535768 RepID=UPI002674C6F5|nr:DUF6300 family protein [Streptomyces lunaelactis]